MFRVVTSEEIASTRSRINFASCLFSVLSRDSVATSQIREKKRFNTFRQNLREARISIFSTVLVYRIDLINISHVSWPLARRLTDKTLQVISSYKECLVKRLFTYLLYLYHVSWFSFKPCSRGLSTRFFPSNPRSCRSSTTSTPFETLRPAGALLYGAINILRTQRQLIFQIFRSTPPLEFQRTLSTRKKDVSMLKDSQMQTRVILSYRSNRC